MDGVQRIEGVVISGRQLGRKLGFPTANIALEESIPLSDGVYVALVTLPDTLLPLWAVANLGRNPSVGGGERHLEVHLLDYEGETLYGRLLQVELCEKLREEQLFSSLDALKQQVEEDIMQVRRRMESEKRV